MVYLKILLSFISTTIFSIELIVGLNVFILCLQTQNVKNEIVSTIFHIGLDHRTRSIESRLDAVMYLVEIIMQSFQFGTVSEYIYQSYAVKCFCVDQRCPEVIV